MAQTTTQAIPYCGPADSPDVPYWMQRLAERVAVLLDALGITVADHTTKLGKAPLGALGYVKTAATSVGLFNSATVTDSVNVALVQDRFYKATYRLNVVCPGAANIAYSMDVRKATQGDLSNATGTSVTDSATLYTPPVANQGGTQLAEFTWRAAATENITIKVLMTRLTGTATYDISARTLTVIDLGKQF